MKLYLENIGKIKEATIALDGITVIAGENNTGKSTVSRAVFSMLNNFGNVNKRINGEMKNGLEYVLLPVYYTRSSAHNAAREIIEHMDEYKESPKLLHEYITKSTQRPFILKEINTDEVITTVLDCLKVSRNEIFCTALEKNLNVEFNFQIQNIYAKEVSKIELRLEDKVISVSIQDAQISNSDLIDLNDLGVSAIYLDSPMILDKGAFYQPYFDYDMNHQDHLQNCLFSDEKRSTLVEEIVASKKLNRIFKIISEVCSGDFIKKDGKFGYREKTGGNILNPSNLSAGLKTFVILKTLLLKGFIESGTVVILDEPEIHLHPEWQLVFAEIIVLLHKEFDVYVLLNTHSHYFLDAIEVYSKKHGVSDVCQYYLSSLDGEFAVMENVTGNTEKIYQKLARPLQQLENERYHNEN